MKSILLSIRPQWLVKILNGEKTIEVRKLFPKDYVGWVYLYCSKNGGTLCPSYKSDNTMRYVVIKDKYDDVITNGHIVARFWCDKVEEIKLWYSPAQADNCVDYDVWYHETESLDDDELLYRSCLSGEKLINYLCRKNNNEGYAIHISKLEIFDRPKELSEFHTVNKYGIPQYQFGKGTCDYKKITKAPQNYCYIEGE